MFIWLTLPPCDINRLAAAALEHGVAVVPSSVFYPQDVNAEPALRINFTHATEQELVVAIELHY